MSYDFDLFVIGGGSGGIACGRRVAGEYGAKVGLAEFDRLGGTCVNRGCIPKKLMVYASRFPGYFSDSQGFGWSQPSSNLDWKHLNHVINNEIDRLNKVYLGLLERAKVKLYPTRARLLDPHTIQVGEETVTAAKILLAVGGRPVKPNIPGIEYIVVSDGMFQLEEQPQRIVIIGGGYIGVEFACIFNGLGSEVTLVIRKDKILTGFDDDLRTEIQNAMQQKGIRILANTSPIAISKTPDCLKMTVCEGNDEMEVLFADAVGLSATGRIPNLEYLGLENTGVKLEQGAISVDQYSRTSEENIYAVGDCTNRVNLTPVAIDEGRALADTVFGGKDRVTSYENIPSAVFTTPEGATVGLTEAQACQKYGEDAIKVYKAHFRSTYNSLSGRDEKTMMKLVVEKSSDRVLGAHMVGESAAEIIQGVAIALKTGATKANFDATIGIHPTVAEEFVTMR